MNKTYHIPALLNETIEALNIKDNGIYIDATFGGGGHSKEIFKKLSTGKLIAFDQDPDASANAWQADNFILIQSNFQYIKNFIEYLKIDKVDGILADLGLSTHHINEAERGFSFRFDARLDMRMNPKQQIDAHFIINNYPQKKLTDILKNYGQISNAYKIANAICLSRTKKQINTTFELVDIVKKYIPKKNEQKSLAKIFQAIRIEVNDEIGTLKKFLLESNDILKKGGRIAIISYHSLEDKIVKSFFKTGNFDNERKTDMYGNIIRPLKPINNKVIVPSENEINTNNRIRSAKLRIAEKI
jgi:16S rRNA (cytosine1402-N4)-methyltransferase